MTNLNKRKVTKYWIKYNNIVKKVKLLRDMGISLKKRLNIWNVKTPYILSVSNNNVLPALKSAVGPRKWNWWKGSVGIFGSKTKKKKWSFVWKNLKNRNNRKVPLFFISG